MTGALLLFVAIALGHLCLTIGILNWSQGLGINAKWMDDAVLLALAAVGAIFLLGTWTVWGLPVAEWPRPMAAYAFVCLGILLIVLPASTVGRHWPRAPLGVRCLASEIEDLADRFGADSLIGEAPSGRLLKVPGNESLTLRRSEWAVALEGLPRGLEGLSILHLTDLHFAPSYRRRFFEEVVDLAMADAPEPDLVLLTGDILDDDDAAAWIVPVLGRLRARIGKVAILGNHDYRHDFRSIRRELRRAEFTALEGRWATLEAGGARVVLGGTAHPWGRDLDASRMPEGDVRILLSHAPDQVYRAASWGIDLMLCGHNHGGQVRFPVLGPVLMPSRFGRRFDRGFYKVGETMMFVGQGIGGKHPLRFGCVPEVTRFRLQSRMELPIDKQDPFETMANV